MSGFRTIISGGTLNPTGARAAHIETLLARRRCELEGKTLSELEGLVALTEGKAESKPAKSGAGFVPSQHLAEQLGKKTGR